MPFYALSYHIGVRKGMEGHRKGIGHKLEESLFLYQKENKEKHMCHFFAFFTHSDLDVFSRHNYSMKLTQLSKMRLT